MTATVVAHVLTSDPNPTVADAVLLVVSCPYCGGTHLHGGWAADSDHGERHPGCRDDTSGAGYRVVQAAPAR